MFLGIPESGLAARRVLRSGTLRPDLGAPAGLESRSRSTLPSALGEVGCWRSRWRRIWSLAPNSLFPQGVRDGRRLAVLGNVRSDAQEVSDVCCVGQRFDLLSAPENGDGLNNGVERVAGDRGEKVSCGIVEVQTCQRVGDIGPHHGVLARGESLAREHVTAQDLVEPLSCAGDLVSWGNLGAGRHETGHRDRAWLGD